MPFPVLVSLIISLSNVFLKFANASILGPEILRPWKSQFLDFFSLTQLSIPLNRWWREFGLYSSAFYPWFLEQLQSTSASAGSIGTSWLQLWTVDSEICIPVISPFFPRFQAVVCAGTELSLSWTTSWSDFGRAYLVVVVVGRGHHVSSKSEKISSEKWFSSLLKILILLDSGVWRRSVSRIVAIDALYLG